MDISICIPIEDVMPIIEDVYHYDEVEDGLNGIYQDVTYYFLDSYALSPYDYDRNEPNIPNIFSDGNNVWMRVTFNNQPANLNRFGYSNFNEDLRYADRENSNFNYTITINEYELNLKIYPNFDNMLQIYYQNH
jgi:hypothetical protein